MIKRILSSTGMRVRNKTENFIMDTIIDESIDKLIGKFKNHFGFNILYNPTGFASEIGIREIYKWIKKYYPDYNKLFDNEQNEYLFIMNKSFLIKFQKDTYAYVCTGNKIRNMKTIFNSEYFRNNLNYDQKWNNMSIINIYIFGKKSRRYYNELNSKLNSVTSEQLFTFTVSGVDNSRYRGYNGEESEERTSEGMNVIMSDLKKRDMNTLFYDDRVKERVENHINTFLETKDIYLDKDIPFKTGIMLYGTPGTGKSSLVQAIANTYKASLVLIDMNSFNHLSITQLKQSIEADNKMYIVLLEDIDTLFPKLDREDDSNLDRDDKKVINKLLQFLDSPSKSPSNIIFIATTNHINKLDNAILRTGRFDIKIEVNPIGRETARMMCESFKLSDDTINSILNICTFPVVQSYLQGEILKAIKIDTMKKSGNFEDLESITSRKVIVNEDGSSVIEDNSLEIEEVTDDNARDLELKKADECGRIDTVDSEAKIIENPIKIPDGQKIENISEETVNLFKDLKSLEETN